MAYSIQPDASKCAGCLICMLRCSYRFEKAYRLSASKIIVHRQVDQQNEFNITITDECDGCGLCVRYCPYDALTRLKANNEVRP